MEVGKNIPSFDLAPFEAFACTSSGWIDLARRWVRFPSICFNGRPVLLDSRVIDRRRRCPPCFRGTLFGICRQSWNAGRGWCIIPLNERILGMFSRTDLARRVYTPEALKQNLG